MQYNQLALSLVNLVGGTDNILKIRKKPTELRIFVFDNDLVDKEGLINLDRIKKVEENYSYISVKVRKRDLRYLFDAFKSIPNSVTIKMPKPKEEINDKPFIQRLTGTVFGDFVPLMIGMVLCGYMIGIINYLGYMFGQ